MRRTSKSELLSDNKRLSLQVKTLRAQLIAAISKLNRKKRDPDLTAKILRLRQEGRSYSEIGRRLEVSYDCVRGRCRYPRKTGVAKKAI